jgi:hypothetical protein
MRMSAHRTDRAVAASARAEEDAAGADVCCLLSCVA